MGKIGYHIHLGALGHQNEETQETAKETGAAFHLLMSKPEKGINTEADLELLDKWAEALNPAQIIWRTYSHLEGDWSLFPPNEEIVKRWLAEDRPQYIRDDPANEASLSGNDPNLNRLYVKSRADLLHKATAAGIKVAVGAFGVGTPHENLIADGTYDELIRAVVEGGHYFSVHEYCSGIPGAGDVFPYEKLLNPADIMDVMKPEPWPTAASYQHLRHSDKFVLRARNLGLADPQIIVTAAFTDLIPDANDVLEQLHDKYGIPAYNKDLRGILAWRMYYADAFPAKLFSDVVTQLIKYLDENVYYPDYIKGVCLFSFDWDKDNPEAHNFLNPFLDDFRKKGLPNLDTAVSILTLPPAPPPSAADTISTRSPEFWAKLREIAATGIELNHNELENNILDEDLHDISEDSTADGIPDEIKEGSKQLQSAALQEVSDESASSIRASSTIEIPAITLNNLGGTRWQRGLFHSEAVRVRIAPFTDAEPLGSLSGEKTGEQHIGEIQSDGYTWRWIRYMHQGNMIEGYAASAFYEFKPS